MPVSHKHYPVAGPRPTIDAPRGCPEFAVGSANSKSNQTSPTSRGACGRKSPATMARLDCTMLSRSELATRWRCSIETLKRREKTGVLHGLRLSARMVRYALDEVSRIEREASSNWEVNHE